MKNVTWLLSAVLLLSAGTFGTYSAFADTIPCTECSNNYRQCRSDCVDEYFDCIDAADRYRLQCIERERRKEDGDESMCDDRYSTLIHLCSIQRTYCQADCDIERDSCLSICST